jgi:hypothetical protein
LSARRTSRALGVGAAAALLLVLVLVEVAPRVAAAADCAKDEVEIGIVQAQGCFTSRTPTGQAPVYETTQPFQMNGFKVNPHSGVTVTFSPADGQKRGPGVTTNNGFVDLTATGSSYGDVHFNNMNFAFSPPSSGEFTLAQSALAQPYISLSGLTPLSVTQPIVLNDDGTSSFDLTFALSGLLGALLTGSEKERAISIGIPFKAKNGSYTNPGFKFGASDIEIAKLLTVNELDLDVEPAKLDVSLDAGLKAVGDKGLVGALTYEDGKVTQFKLGASGLNVALGASGIFLQKLVAQVFTAPPFGGSGTIGITAGGEKELFGREVSAVGVEGTVGLRGNDDANHVPGYFSVDGNASVMSLPVANANFKYNFGQGTEFGASVGIGLPSLTNDPGQPTYVGGGFNGWTSANHFDLQGNNKLKVAGIDLAGAQTVISDIGFAGCVQILAWIGGGIHWSDGSVDVLGGWSCDTSGYQPQRSKVAKLAAAGSTPLHLEKRERIIRIEAAPGAEAPQATLTGPSGETIQTPPPGDSDGIRQSKAGAAFSDNAGTSTFIVRPSDSSKLSAAQRGGAWQLEEVPGSSGIETVATAHVLRPPKVHARVVGHGRKRTLRWRARDVPHQRLQFTEKLPGGQEIPILKTRKASGHKRFIPVEGAGTYGVKRRLAVDVRARFNTPRDTLVTDRYVVRRQRAPSRVKRMHAERRLDDLVVRWKHARRAASYRVSAVAVGAGDNATYLKDVGRDRHRVRFHGLGVSGKLRVAVRPSNAQGRRGPAARRTVDTNNLVPSRRAAARRMVKHARLTHSGRVVTHPACPDTGHCEVSLRVYGAKRMLGRKHIQLPPDMTDRLVVKLPRQARHRVRRGKLTHVRARARVAQLDGGATATGVVRR